jgi:hypothetical protein
VPGRVDLLALDAEQAARRVEAGGADRDAVGLAQLQALEERSFLFARSTVRTVPLRRRSVSIVTAGRSG